MDDTVNGLEQALERTRMNSCGITIDLVARTIVKMYDKWEVNELIDRLEALQID